MVKSMKYATTCLGALSMALLLPLFLAGRAAAADQPQWGQFHSRNMVSSETGLPATFNPETGENIKWSVPLGNAYGPPTIAGGRVLIGTNNAALRDPRHDGDRGVLFCLNETDGTLQWQLVVPRLTDDKYKDWPMIGMSSPPTIDGDRIYTLTNRFEVVCLDLQGMADGNDGPYVDEGKHMVPEGEAPLETTPLDADILWVVDMQNDPAISMYPHDSAYGSILLDGNLLYVNSGNGVDNSHQVIRKPDAPSLIVLDKETGRLVAKDAEHMGPDTIHGTWSSPSLGEVNGARRVFFGGGNGICYAFEALDSTATAAPLQPLTRVWRFDGDPTAPKEKVHEYLNSREVSPSNIKGMPVFHENRVYITVGGDIWWGKEKSWLKCIDASGEGDITATGEVWSYPMNHHSSSSAAIADGLIYITDCAGLLHCVDLATGQPVWTHELRKEIWGSALVADGKVYVGSYGGDLCVLAAGREKNVLATIVLNGPIGSTPVAANGVLYVNSLNTLYALALPGAP
jgi:outer membrane protein assembly factor BamB